MFLFSSKKKNTFGSSMDNVHSAKTEAPTMSSSAKIENDKIKVTKKGKIKTTKIGYFFDCKKIV